MKYVFKYIECLQVTLLINIYLWQYFSVLVIERFGESDICRRLQSIAYQGIN